MSYPTVFHGHFTITPALSEPHRAFLERLAATERVRRHEPSLRTVPDPLREAVGLDIGHEGAFYVGEADVGQVLDAAPPGGVGMLKPPKGQPSLRLRWRPSADGTRLEWDGDRTFEGYTGWLDYLMHHCFKPWGYTLSGRVAWTGHYHHDSGEIEVHNNYVRVTDVGMGDDED